MDWWSINLLSLGKFNSRVCSAIMFTSLNSIINSSQAVGFLNSVHTCFRTTICCVLALAAISSWHSLDSNKVGAFIFSTLAYSEHLYKKVSTGHDNDWGTASLCKVLTSTCASFVWMSFSSFWSLRPCSRAWLRSDARSSNVTGQFTPKFWSLSAISQHGFLSARQQIVLSSCACDDPCNVRRHWQHST